MANYRDYGALNGASAPLVPINTTRYTQVYQATHEGALRRPFMERSFISFSYGEKPDSSGVMRPVYIEDFNLIATISGDRWSRDAYGSFDDLTSTYDTINGQFYWGTYFRSTVLNFTLSTDYMTQRQLDDFKLWFRAGQIKELILAEHPNRAALARVSSPPKIEMIPFEEKIEVPLGLGGINGEEEVQVRIYKTSTTVYRGDIELELTLDEPFWYAKQNILGIQNKLEGYYDESWVNANGQVVSVRDNPDALKIVYEDRIPLGSTTRISVFLGGDTFATVLYNTYSRIVRSIDEATYTNILADENLSAETKASYYNNGNTKINGQYIFPADNENGYEQYYYGAVIATTHQEGDEEIYDSGGKIGGAEFKGSSSQANGISLPADETANLYYAGTAPSPVKLSFTLIPQFENFWITSPRNKYTSDDKPYNTITLTAVKQHDFKFTLPTLYASYNQVLKILDDENIMALGNAWLLVRETIRDTIRHPLIRAWANKMLDKYVNEYGSGIIANLATSDGNVEITLDQIIGDIKDGMHCLFRPVITITNENPETHEITNSYQLGEAFPASFTFDGKTGAAVGTFTTLDPAILQIKPIADHANNLNNGSLRSQIIDSVKNAATADPVKNTTKETVENVGDMVKSSYLILDERNVLDDNFQVQAWEATHPDYSYLISHDVVDRLLDLHFEFKNMYL